MSYTRNVAEIYSWSNQKIVLLVILLYLAVISLLTSYLGIKDKKITERGKIGKSYTITGKDALILSYIHLVQGIVFLILGYLVFTKWF